ncbi:MAG: hypothetical protein NVS2B3_07080 [Vulcanimicrobiaceae bacterium]
MKRSLARNPIPPLIVIATLIALAGSYAFFQKALLPRYAASRRVLASRSDLRLSMRVRYDAGPLVEERFAMRDLDGLSSSSYRVLGRSGLQITIEERPRKTIEAGPNVAFFFQEAVADGIWELRSKPPRGDRRTQYALDVYQDVNGEHGARHVTFTDPHYWATTGGHQFTLHLKKNEPVPDLLHLTSTTLVEPRYERIVADFRNFGPESFRRKVSAARLRLGARP